MVETPGGQSNLGILEDYVLRGLCRKETIGSGTRGRTKTFWRFGTVWCCDRREQTARIAGGAKMSHQMLYLLEGYLDNIVAAATETEATGGPLA